MQSLSEPGKEIEKTINKIKSEPGIEIEKTTNEIMSLNIGHF